MYSLLIKNAMVYDGTPNPGAILDVAIQGDQIVNIAQNIPVSAQSIVDAKGKILAPGFVDIQNHSDSYWQIFDNPNFHSLILQGFTTIVIGNCGASLAPLLSPDALKSIQKWHNLEGSNINWQSFSEFIEELAKRRFGCNIATLAGYSTMRRGLVGDQVRSLEKSELDALKKILMESLDAGAFGLSTGLAYAHEITVSEVELYELAKILKLKNALLSVHLKDESNEIIESVQEAVDIAQATGVNYKISHLKIRQESNWEKFEDLIKLLDTAYHRGNNIHFDVYPYDTVWQVLYSYMPKWAVEGGRQQMLKNFSDPVKKNKILNYLNSKGTKFSQLIVASSANRLSFFSKTIGQIAKNLECSSEQAVLHVLEQGGSEILVFEKNLNSAQVADFLCHPLAFVATDGGGFNDKIKDKLVHPRCFGTAPKFLKEYAQSGKLSWQEAVSKLSSRPAKKIGLKKRGEIKIGNFADMVILNPDTISDLATYQNPNQYSVGIDSVFVNGKLTVHEGKITGNMPGYVLRKS